MKCVWLVLVVVLVLLVVGVVCIFVSCVVNVCVLEVGIVDCVKVFVWVVLVCSSVEGQMLVLLGSLQGFVQLFILVCLGGYFKCWIKDIGLEVKKGELLVEFDILEIDQ